MFFTVRFFFYLTPSATLYSTKTKSRRNGRRPVYTLCLVSKLMTSASRLATEHTNEELILILSSSDLQQESKHISLKCQRVPLTVKDRNHVVVVEITPMS